MSEDGSEPETINYAASMSLSAISRPRYSEAKFQSVASSRSLSTGLNVRFGSLADIRVKISDVRFAPESRHAHHRHQCLLSAYSGHSAGAKRRQILRKAQHLIIKWKLVCVRTSKSTLIYVNLPAGEQRLLVFKDALPCEAGEHIG